jgi:hypothetical protein
MESRWVWTRLDPTRPDPTVDGGDGVVVFPEPVVADRRSLALPLVCNQVKLRAALASHFSERDVEFFVREIADNRVKKVGEFVNSKLAARRAAAHSVPSCSPPYLPPYQRGEKAFCYREFAVRLREAYTTATNGTHHVVVDDGDDCCAVADDFLREVVRHHPVMPDRVRDLCDSVP